MNGDLVVGSVTAQFSPGTHSGGALPAPVPPRVGHGPPASTDDLQAKWLLGGSTILILGAARRLGSKAGGRLRLE
jgi:hypothetical protein